MQRSLRRSQSGQSIVILALGFVALLGFVGIVTDVSLMFVRFSTLTRAVDAASIAAAGQVRRQVPFQSEINDHCVGVGPDGRAWSPSNPCPEAEAAAFARSFGNVGVAARQFIEFYGLDPSAVLIDMCFTVSTLDPDTRDLIPLNTEVADEFNELCVGPTGRNSDRKLIKVTAQIESPTVFLHLLGFSAIPLQASSISETAVLDVVLIMDVSESMLNQTTPVTWAEKGYTNLYIPPDIWYDNYMTANNPGGPLVGFGSLRNHNFADLTNFQDYGNNTSFPGRKWDYFRYQLSQLTPAEAQSLLCIGDACNTSGGNRSPFEVQVKTLVADGHRYDPPASADFIPRSECRVQYFPYAFGGFPIPPSLQALYQESGVNDGDGWKTRNGWRDAYVPTYDFYRCCNDPDGDGLFTDLLCQPFRDARDATELFLQRIDFLRGDRVAFVTFDRRAFLVTVEVDKTEHIWSHMIDNEATAIETLTQSIGVRAEPSFYNPTVLPDGTQAVPWVSDDEHRWARSGLLGDHDYEVKDNCPFQDAAYISPYSPSSSAAPGNEWNFPHDPFTYPNRLKPIVFDSPAIQRMYPRNGADTWQNVSGYAANRSYDMWASCRGTNIGAALRAGGNALVDPRTTRTNGSVWVMVMLSDGAAGASDPVFDSSIPGGPGTEPPDLYYPYNSQDYRVAYGGLGLCPPGVPGNRTELTQYDESPQYLFPFCSDELPESRHFCFDPNHFVTVSGQRIPAYVDLGASFCNAPLYYDVDDYARDWADWIGLSEPPGLAASSQRNLTQLPTIFTIGFGLNFVNGTTECEATSMNIRDVPDCLGEELLRYVADVGDNFRIDSDYQQALLTNQPNDIIGGMTDEDFGPRGECEDALPPGVNPSTVGSIGNLVDPKTAGTSCGNYYNAPGGEELNRVFDDIASRMFTRLTQ
jgi:hypothetical protein